MGALSGVTGGGLSCGLTTHRRMCRDACYRTRHPHLRHPGLDPGSRCLALRYRSRVETAGGNRLLHSPKLDRCPG